ncbi:MAG: hypothetical protein JRI74_09180 [Deltaproteobacteria bacterium]|nr:hypothetical protein [Deltaproteobacteria bacterium]
MAYTPELTQEHSGTLRRIAWALGIPMTKAIHEVVDYVSRIMDWKKVCDACRDNSFCGQCPFNRSN